MTLAFVACAYASALKQSFACRVIDVRPLPARCLMPVEVATKPHCPVLSLASVYVWTFTVLLLGSSLSKESSETSKRDVEVGYC